VAVTPKPALDRPLPIVGVNGTILAPHRNTTRPMSTSVDANLNRNGTLGRYNATGTGLESTALATASSINASTVGNGDGKSSPVSAETTERPSIGVTASLTTGTTISNGKPIEVTSTVLSVVVASVTVAAQSTKPSSSVSYRILRG
jgi:hypothetical protein